MLEKLGKNQKDKSFWTSPMFSSFDIRYLLSTIEAPLLLVQSEDDTYGSMDQISWIVDYTNSRVKETLILEEAGHSPHLSARNALMKGLSSFLASL